MSTFPEKLFDFAFIPLGLDNLDQLRKLAEEENWSYQYHADEHPHPVLFYYLQYTYKRLAEERKITLSEDGQFSCFNTGLVTNNQEPLFASFEVNRQPGLQPWFFKGWFRKGQWELTKFSELPELAEYFNDPSCLVLDHRKEIRPNVEHFIEDSPRDRLPEHYRDMNDYALQTVIKGAIDNAKERVRRNYKTAIPQYHRGSVQLLLPLCLDSPERADLALVVERHPTFYRASTCLTLDMAYCNARQLARPDRDWLKP